MVFNFFENWSIISFYIFEARKNSIVIGDLVSITAETILEITLHEMWSRLVIDVLVKILSVLTN